MQPTAAMRFFEVPELMAHLTCHFLDHKSISGLMRTSRHLYALCTPGLFYHVLAEYDAKKQNLLASKESIEALARNVHHVRHLELDILDMVYYVNCVFAYLDQDQPSTLPPADVVVTGKEKAQDQEVTTVSRPRWLAPPDPQICAIFPVPPMTLLSRIELNMSYYSLDDGCPYYLPSCRDPRATLTQVCWLIDSNPFLTDFSLYNIFMKDQRDIKRLSRSLSGLERLQNAYLGFYQWEDSRAIPNLLMAMFLCCPPSLRTLGYEETENNEYWTHFVSKEYTECKPGELHSWESYSDEEEEEDEGEDEELWIGLFRPQKESKIHLTSLRYWINDQNEVSEDELRRILALCPNLTDIMIPSVRSIEDPQQLAQEIARTFCPRLTALQTADYDSNSTSWELMVRILEALPEQQVQKFHCLEQVFMILGLRSDDVGSMFRRQSRTLRELRVQGCRNLDSKAIQVILVECVALEQLEIQFQDGSLRSLRQWERHQQLLQLQQLQQQKNPQCIGLDDAVEFPWGCTRIRELKLAIAIPSEPFHHLAEGVVPYYDRPSPIILTEEEKTQFRSLEALYRQLGALTELERLDLKAIYHDPIGSRRVSHFDWGNSFPGMLNLRNEETGRPGYLHHLGGLSKLKALFGSVSAKTKETKVTIGMEEVKWMDRHWPALEKAYFFTNKDEKTFTEPFQWLVKQRAGSDRSLQLASSY